MYLISRLPLMTLLLFAAKTFALVAAAAALKADHDITVTPLVPGGPNCTLTFMGQTHQCALGKNGVTTKKQEGDGCTPAGSFPMRRAFYRADKRKRPAVASWLPLNATKQDDGWCDAEGSLYNQFTTFPLPKQCSDAEHLWLTGTDVYDFVGVIGYNDDPAVPNKGSAIFFHVAHPEWEGTAGCVTVLPEVWEEVMENLTEDSLMVIEAN